ncbi:aspartic peptidase domain-containing protein [Scleroderma citrinum]
MFSPTPLLLTTILAVAIAASPLQVRNTFITLPFLKRFNVEAGIIKLLEHDQARAAALLDHGNDIVRRNFTRRTRSITVINETVSYVATVGVGIPSSTYHLIVDTGSSNMWIGANSTYQQTNSSGLGGLIVSVSYGSSSFTGLVWYDTISLGSDFILPRQSIAVASVSQGFTTVDGVLGIGPVDLTKTTFTIEPNHTAPTVSDNLFNQGLIAQELVGMSFAPTNPSHNTTGELIFGGVDSSKYTGTLNNVPLTNTKPAAYFWGIDESITYGSATILSGTAGIVDTGTSLILIASDAFSKYQSLTGAVQDNSTGLLRITNSQYDSLHNLNFSIGNNSYTLTPNAQIWPRVLNTYIGGSPGYIYLIVADIGWSSGQGLDLINGQAFLERFYSALDTTNSRVGFALTTHTYATIN